MVQERTFSRRVVMLGFGSVGQGMLPLLLAYFGLRPAQVTVLSASADGAEIARGLGVELLVRRIAPGNLEAVLAPLLAEGDFLLNVSIDVSSLALMRLCRQRGALYLDSCSEPWPGRYDNPGLPPTARSNYALREEMLAFGRERPDAPTACITQGANPGLVSAFVREALLKMAADVQLDLERRPAAPADWARLAQRLGIKVIHVAERDTQASRLRRQRGEFVNTWSVEAFVDEGLQPSELGWGSHERHWPADALRHEHGCGAAIMLNRPGIATRVRSWTPLEGAYHGFLVTHAESVSIADHLTLRDPAGQVSYRPTVNYAYHPCDDTVSSLQELAGRNWRLQRQRRLLRDDLTEGMEELGVLLMGHPRGVYWYGSRLSVAQARALVPHNNATSLQVCAGILGAMVWALAHPRASVVEADDIPHDALLRVAAPYLGDLVGVWGDWTPLKDRSTLFPTPQDPADPWQFLNFRVS